MHPHLSKIDHRSSLMRIIIWQCASYEYMTIIIQQNTCSLSSKFRKGVPQYHINIISKGHRVQCTEYRVPAHCQVSWWDDYDDHHMTTTIIISLYHITEYLLTAKSVDEMIMMIIIWLYDNHHITEYLFTTKVSQRYQHQNYLRQEGFP